ncbi:MAG: hypothetical protein GY953_56660 [bacterium]|nr:hypothetical protein [bacterium]
MALPASNLEFVEPRTRFYVFDRFYLKHGTQLGRFHEFAKNTLLPMLASIHTGPRIVFEAIVAEHMPQVATIFGVSSMDEYFRIHEKMASDEEFIRAFAAWEDGPEQPAEHYSSTLLEATDYSPAIDSDARATEPGIFELRVYHSPSQRQLAALNERFAGPEIRIFHRVDIHPLFYSETVFGPWMPSLVYLIPFASLAERERAWSAFAADPDWRKVRQESIDRHGNIASVVQMTLFKAADYSPVR